MKNRQLISALVWFGATASAGEVRYVGEGHPANPTWSVDGRYLAFEVHTFGSQPQMHISEVTGEVAIPAIQVNLPGNDGPFGGSGVATNPLWHPAGFVVFGGSDAHGRIRLYRSTPGAQATAQLIRTPEFGGDLTPLAIDAAGRSLTFSSGRGGGEKDLYTRDFASGRVEALAFGFNGMTPRIAPDGDTILTTRRSNGEDIVEMDRSSGQRSPVAGGVRDQTRPDHAAEGWIVFFDNARESNAWDLVSVSGPGGRKTILAEDVRLPLRARPALSEDGRWAVFGYADPTKSSRIGMVKIDGSETLRIGTAHTGCGEPALTEVRGQVRLAYSAHPDGEADRRTLFVEDLTGILLNGNSRELR